MQNQSKDYTMVNLSDYRNAQRTQKIQGSIWHAFQSLYSADLHRNIHQNGYEKPPIYLITPTWPRPVQIAELTRLGYVLKVSSNAIFDCEW